MKHTADSGAYSFEDVIRRIFREEIRAAMAEEVLCARGVTQVLGPATRALGGPRALTPAGAAEKIGLSEQTLANWRVLGKGPTWFKVGRLVRYDEAEIDAWIVGQRSNPAAGL